jgi:hypothetical protein
VQLGLLAARVASAREARLDSEDPHDRSAAPLAREVHVDASADLEAQDVGPGLRVPRRPPHDLPAPGAKPSLRAPDGLRGTAGAKGVRPQHVELHGCRAVEPETDDRAVAEAVAVRRDRRQQSSVTRERLRAVRDVDAVQRRRHGGQEKRQRAHAGRIRTPNREATNGTVAPWTMTENVTTTKTIS